MHVQYDGRKNSTEAGKNPNATQNRLTNYTLAKKNEKLHTERCSLHYHIAKK